jgi:putative oxidoreductase
MDTNDLSLFILQLGIGLTFAAHGAQKVFGWWGGPGLLGWEGAMEHMGFRPARLFALASAFVELGAGLLLAAGLLTPFVAAALVAQAVVIIVHVHWGNGFFNARSGIEFPLLLGLGAAAVGLAGSSGLGVDALIGFIVEPSGRLAIVLGGIGAGLIALAVPRLASQRNARAV